MYKYGNGQLSLSDFKQSIGMKMNPENRWVKKAELIPWAEIEERYAKLFTNRKRNVAKPLVPASFRRSTETATRKRPCRYRKMPFCNTFAERWL